MQGASRQPNAQTRIETVLPSSGEKRLWYHFRRPRRGRFSHLPSRHPLYITACFQTN